MNAVIEQRKVLLEIADLKVHFDIKEGKQWANPAAASRRLRARLLVW